LSAGTLSERAAFDELVLTDDAHGGQERGWVERHVCAAEFRYQRGAEAEVAGTLTGTARFKVKIRSCAVARQITPEWRMRDARSGVMFNIREVDAISDRSFVWIIVDGGVAV